MRGGGGGGGAQCQICRSRAHYLQAQILPYWQLVHNGHVSGVNSHETLGEMDAVIQRVPYQDGQRYGLHDPQLPAEAPEQAPQGQQDGYYGDHHGNHDPEVVSQHHDDDGTQDERENNPVE